MLVQAKCTRQCWDSTRCVMYYPGFTYEIDSESQLATLTTVAVAYNDQGQAVRYTPDPKKAGEYKEVVISKPPYIFEFDRNAARKDDGTVGKADYTCKVCGIEFKSVNALGTHSRKVHTAAHQEPDDEPVVVEKRGRKFTCKACGEVCTSLPALMAHRKVHAGNDAVTETLSVPV